MSGGLPGAALVVVTPVFEDAAASWRLFQELAASLGDDVFVVAVDDGSVREPVSPQSLREAGLDGVVIRLRRNVGHQRAIAIGLGHVVRDLRDSARVVVMDSDGEDVPASIPELLRVLEDDEVDVVVAQRRGRQESLGFRAFYAVYRTLFRLLVGRRIAFGNFMALKPAAVRRVAAMQESWIHIAGCVLMSKLRVKACPLDRGPRYAGSSKMNFVGLALHGFRALMVFAEDVLVRVGTVCALIAGLAIVSSLAAIFLKLVGMATPGWFSVALGILFLVFLQTGALTLMTLMLTGVVRSGVIAPANHADFIETVLHVGQARG